MSNSAEFSDTVNRYVKARVPFVSIRTGERKRALRMVREVFNDLDLPVSVHTLTQGFRDLRTNDPQFDERSTVGALDLIGQQVAQRQNMTFVMSDLPDIDSDGPTARTLYDVVALAEENGGAVMVLTSNPVWPALQRLGMTVTLDPPDRDEMRTLISGFVDDYRSHFQWDETHIDRAAAVLNGVSEIEAENALATIVAKGSVSAADLSELTRIKDRMFSDISGIERVVLPEGGMRIGGLEGLQRWLDKQKVFLTADLRDRELPPPRGVLLVGVPGCGKSLSAKAIASSWDLPLYRLDLASVLGQYVGQSEGRLREALETADHIAPCVLWIDEIEKGLAGGGSDSSGVTTRLIGQFLYWLQESKAPVFVVATANDVHALPGELLRKGRFDELFFIDLPTASERRSIIDIYANRFLRQPFPEPLLQRLETISKGFTGADIEAAMRDVGKEAHLFGDDAVSEDKIIEIFENLVPLSRTNPERVEEIRGWGRERAVPASEPEVDEEGPAPRRKVLS